MEYWLIIYFIGCIIAYPIFLYDCKLEFGGTCFHDRYGGSLISIFSWIVVLYCIIHIIYMYRTNSFYQIYIETEEDYYKRVNNW